MDLEFELSKLCLLLENGLAPKKLHRAVSENKIKLVKKLLAKGEFDLEDKTAMKMTPLHIAAFMGHFEIATLLLENGANVNAIGRHNQTPIHFAALNGQTKIIPLLVKVSYFQNSNSLFMISSTFEFSRQKVDSKIHENGMFQSILNLK